MPRWHAPLNSANARSWASNTISCVSPGCTKNARRIFAIISTISIPTSASKKHGSHCGPSAPGSRLDADYPENGGLIPCRFTHKIVDVFTKRLEVPKYARMVSVEEIEKNEFNLNLPRYIDSQTPEDLQDIYGHSRGGIPVAAVDGVAGH